MERSKNATLQQLSNLATLTVTANSGNQRPTLRDLQADKGFLLVLLSGVLYFFYCLILYLPRSLWLDELITTAQLDHDIGTSVRNMIYGMYSTWGYTPILCYMRWLFGSGEITLRLPSVVFGILSVVAFYKAGTRYFSVGMMAVASVFILVTPQFIYCSLNARPYTFALWLVILSIDYALRFRVSPSLFNTVASAVFPTSILYVHPVYFLATAPILVFLHFNTVIKGKDRLAPLFAVFLISLCAIYPILPRLRAMFNGATYLTYHAKIGFCWGVQLGMLAYPLLLLVCLATLVGRALGGRTVSLVTSEKLLHASCLWLFPMTILYGATWATGSSLYLSRYLLVAMPGMAILLAYVTLMWTQWWMRMLMAVAVVFGACSVELPDIEIKPKGWREMVSVVDSKLPRDGREIILRACNAEEASASLFDNPALRRAFISPLEYYQLGGRISIVPLGTRDPGLRMRLKDVVNAAITRGTIVGVLFGCYADDPEIIPRFKSAGWDCVEVFSPSPESGDDMAAFICQPPHVVSQIVS